MPRILSEFFKGIKAYPKAYQFTNQHQLWRFYWIPALINLVIFVGVLVLGWHYSSGLTAYLKTYLMTENLPNWIVQTVGWLMNTLLRLIVLILLIKLYRFLVMLLLAPVLGMVAEKVLVILLKCPEPPFDTQILLRNIWRGLRLTIGNMIIELMITIPLMLLSLIVPLLAPLTTVAILITESYFIGFGAIDLRNEFLKLSGSESKKVIWYRKGLSVGNGILFNTLILVPVIGALFVPIFSVVAGTLAIQEMESENPTVPYIVPTSRPESLPK